MILRIFLFLISLFICFSVFAQTPTNQQIVAIKTATMLDSIGSNLPDSLKVIAFKTSVANRETNSYLLNEFVQYFAKGKITVSLDSALFSVVFESFDINIEYQENKTGMFGLNRDLRRTITFKANGYLIDNSRMDVVDPFHFDSVHRDIIQSDDLGRIEGAPYAFCRGIITDAVTWTKYIEPGIVIISVVGIVYLLFAMRF